MQGEAGDTIRLEDRGMHSDGHCHRSSIPENQCKGSSE